MTVLAGLERAELVIAQDAFFETETNGYADVLLPASLWTESEGVMVNSERNLTLFQAAEFIVVLLLQHCAIEQQEWPLGWER